MDKKSLMKGVAVSPLDLKKKIRVLVKKYRIFYLGGEFCQNIFPGEEELSSLFDSGAEKVVLTTAFMVSGRLARTKDSLSCLLERFPALEIMINDFGLLSYLNKFHPKTVKGVARPLSVDFMRMSPVYLNSFFKKHKLSRLETDEDYLLGGLDGKVSFGVTLHYPFRFAAMSRACPFFRKISQACDRSCLGRYLKIPVQGSAEPMWAFNNAYFIKYAPFFSHNCVDRTVFHEPESV